MDAPRSGLLLLAVAAACAHDSKSPPTRCAAQDGNRSGTQLKIAWFESDDGTFARGMNGQIWSVDGTTTCHALYRPAFDGQNWWCRPNDCQDSPYAPTQYLVLGGAPVPDSTFAQLHAAAEQ